MSDCLIAFDKLPVVRLVVIGEMWCRLFAKCLIKVSGSDATHACRYYQLCYGLNAGINGAVQGVQSIWVANFTELKMVSFTC